MNFSHLLRAGLAALLLWVAPSPSAAQDPARAYYAYVAAESEDQVALVRFDGTRAAAVKTIPVGTWPTEIEGPHGVTVSPDGKYWFVSIAHGFPYGRVFKYETGTDEVIGQVEVGLFPATMEISPTTGLLYVVNFNLHGDKVPSTVSVIEPETMTEIARVPHGVMPHGSRISPDGLHHYSVAMMDNELIEIDAATLEVTRRMKTYADHGASMRPTRMPKPTWADPHPLKPFVYVANNGTDEVVEVDLKAWVITRRFATGKAPYNLEVSPDGRRLVVSYKGEGATGVWDLDTGQELARIPNSRKVTHGVAITPDGKYAFVTAEGIGGEPGGVDVMNLETLTRVATADVGKQAGGIYFWKMEDRP